MPRRGRALRRLGVVLAVAVLASAWSARAALADGVQLSLSTNATTPGAPVTMTATVTSSLGAPTGTVSFVNVGVTPWIALDSTVGETLNTVDANTTSATFTDHALGEGTYTVEAIYSPDPLAFLSGITAGFASPSQQLVVASTPPPPTTYSTQTTLSAPASVTSSSGVSLIATVTRCESG